MAMNVGPSNDDDDVMIEVNMTPLIDVMLVLIIMFIITIPTPNNAININMPNGNPPPSAHKPVVVDLRIDALGKIFWNDTPLPDKAALEARFNGVVKESDQDSIKLKPDAKTDYKDVAMVMALAQRLGITKIGIVAS